MRKASLAVHLVCEFAVGPAYFLPLVVLGRGGGSGAMSLGRGGGSGGSGAMPCLEAPLSPRLLFAGLLLRRLHGEHCRWLRGGADGSSGAPSPGKHRNMQRRWRPSGTDAGRFLFQDAIFGWLDTRRDALAPTGQEHPGSSAGVGRGADDAEAADVRSLAGKQRCRRCAAGALLYCVTTGHSDPFGTVFLFVSLCTRGYSGTSVVYRERS